MINEKNKKASFIQPKFTYLTRYEKFNIVCYSRLLGLDCPPINNVLLKIEICLNVFKSPLVNKDILENRMSRLLSPSQIQIIFNRHNVFATCNTSDGILVCGESGNSSHIPSL